MQQVLVGGPLDAKVWPVDLRPFAAPLSRWEICVSATPAALQATAVREEPEHVAPRFDLSTLENSEREHSHGTRALEVFE
jgi:hypothetical protein